MHLGQSKHCDINYLSKIVKITEFHSHINPEVTKLKCCTIDGFNIICGIDSEPGLYVYFPAMSQINKDFLSFANLFKHKELNQNPNETGMFEDSGRVKAIRLKGQISEGFILPAIVLQNYILSVTNKLIEFQDGIEFNEVQDGDKSFWISKKWTIKVNTGKSYSNKTKGKVSKKLNKVIDTQFRFHYTTVLLKKCPKVISPNDLIHISSKIHGTSAISAYVLCKTNYSKLQSIGNWIVRKLIDPIFRLNTSKLDENTNYDYLYASRTVIKNKYYNSEVGSGYYDVDVWAEADKYLKPHLQKGMTIYSEIVGYTQTGNYIQKGYDYGCIPPKNGQYILEQNFKVRPYRITLTNVDGNVHEFSAREVQQYCKQQGLIPVTELYYGFAKDLYPDLEIDDNWSDNFISKLSDDSRFYMELDSPDCKNTVPHEGIVIRKEDMQSEAFKLKCFRFLNREQEELASGIANIEDNA